MAPDSDGTSCVGAPANVCAQAHLLLLPKRPLPSREGKHRDPGRQLAWSCCNEGPQTRASNTRRSFSPGSGGRKSVAPGGQGALGEGPSAPGGCRHLWARGHVPLLSASILTRGARGVCVPPLLTKSPTGRAPSVLLLLFLVFTYLAAPDPSCGMLASSVAAFGLTCGMWDPVP